MWRLIHLALFCGFVWAQTDFVPTGYEVVTTPTVGSFGASEKCGEGSKINYECVPYHRCDGSTNTIKPEKEKTDESDYTDYSLLIDIR